MNEKFDYSKRPWELNEDLTEIALEAITSVILQKTKECLNERFDQARGDSHYSYGHTARAWRILGIRKLIQSNKIPKMRIVKDKGQSFEFSIGETSMKFYSGAPEEMNSSMMKLSPYECGQLSLNLENKETNSDLFWRIMIDAAPTTHEILRVSYTAFNKFNELVCVYDAPLENVPVFYTVDKKLKEAKKIPNAVFTRKSSNNQTEAI